MTKIWAQCPPELSVSLVTKTLTCYTPTLIAAATSTTSNTQISWTVPAFPAVINESSIIIAPNNGNQIPPTPYFNYTVTVTNTLNLCSTTSIIAIYQNFKPPVSSPSISAPGFICNEAVVLITGNSTVTSGQPGAFITDLFWDGPAPQNTVTGSSTYTAFTPGIYSLTVKDSYNGCTRTGTVNVTSNQPLFNMQGTAPSSSVSCNGSVVISPIAPSGYTISINTGSLSGNTVTNLCYGELVICLTYTDTGCKKCDSLLINGATVINEINFEEEFILYPNPTSSFFYIKSSGQKSGTVKIFNVEGKVIEDLILEGGASTSSATGASTLRQAQGGASSATTEIKNLNPGIYFVEIRIENSVVRKKVVVLR